MLSVARQIPARGLALTALASCGIFTVMALLYKAGVLRAIDAAVAGPIRSVRLGAFDDLAWIDDRVFSSAWSLAIALVFAVVLWLRGADWSWIAPLFIGVSALVDLASRQGFAVFIHPRQLIQDVQILLGSGHVSGLGSFPSGHAERALFLAVLFVAFLPRPVSVPLALLACTTLFARVYALEHRPSEVLAGAVLGVGVGAFALWLVRMLRASRWLSRIRLARGLA